MNQRKPSDRRGNERRNDDRRGARPWVMDLADRRSGYDRRDGDRRSGRDRRDDAAMQSGR